MADILMDTGEEFILDFVFTDGADRPSNIDIGLYDDSTDELEESSDVVDITTEPSGSAYERQSADFPDDFTNSNDEGDWQSVIADQTFDTSDSDQEVDSYFVVIEFDSDEAEDDGTATDHLFFAGSLDQSYDLSQIDSFTLTNFGVGIS